MSAKNRADQITKLFKVLKKEYQPITPPSNRTVMDHAIYACCLENSTAEDADECLAKLQENYFDWNEVRVTTDAELAETVKSLTDPARAARRVKKILYGIFETYYQFDLEFLKKENLSKAVQAFERMVGVSPFVISYISQHGLGGHSIPTDQALLNLMVVLGIVTEEEASKGRIPGLERAIPKAKGIEFASLAHQLSVAFYKSPFSNSVRNQILKIDADAKSRFPKRVTKKQAEQAEKLAAAEAKAKALAKKEAAEQAAQAAELEKQKAASKKSSSKAKVQSSKSAPKKAPAKKTPAKKAPVKKAAAKKVAAKKKTVPAAKKSKAKKTPAKKSTVKKAARKVTKTKKVAAKKSTKKKTAKKSAR